MGLIELREYLKQLHVELKQFPSGSSIGGNPPKPLEGAFKPKEKPWDNGSTFNPGYNWHGGRGRKPGESLKDYFDRKQKEEDLATEEAARAWSAMYNRQTREVQQYLTQWRLAEKIDFSSPISREKVYEEIRFREKVERLPPELAKLINKLDAETRANENRLEEAGGIGPRTVLTVAKLWQALRNANYMQSLVRRGLLTRYHADTLRAIHNTVSMSAMTTKEYRRAIKPILESWVKGQQYIKDAVQTIANEAARTTGGRPPYAPF